MASTKSLVVESALPLSCAVAAESASEAGLGVVAQRRQEPSCSDRRCFPFRGTDARERQSRASQLQSTLEMNACTALGFAGLPRRPDSTMSRKMYFTCAVSVIDSSGQRLVGRSFPSGCGCCYRSADGDSDDPDQALTVYANEQISEARKIRVWPRQDSASDGSRCAQDRDRVQPERKELHNWPSSSRDTD